MLDVKLDFHPTQGKKCPCTASFASLLYYVKTAAHCGLSLSGPKGAMRRYDTVVAIKNFL